MSLAKLVEKCDNLRKGWESLFCMWLFLCLSHFILLPPSHSLCIICCYLSYLFEMQTDRDQSFIHWFTPQKLWTAWSEPGQSQKPETHPGLLAGCLDCNCASCPCCPPRVCEMEPRAAWSRHSDGTQAAHALRSRPASFSVLPFCFLASFFLTSNQLVGTFYFYWNWMSRKRSQHSLFIILLLALHLNLFELNEAHLNKWGHFKKFMENRIKRLRLKYKFYFQHIL